MAVMGRFSSVVSAGAGAVLAALAVGPTLATAGATTTTTTTTRYRPPTVYNPIVTPSTIDNRRRCGHSTTATIATGTTGKVERVTFRVQLGGRTLLLSATPSGNRWQATLNGESFDYDHGPGTVRAESVGPGGMTESGTGSFTIADCPG
jgi:hypothetical protein